MKKLSLKNRISIVVSVVINILCSFFLVYFSFEEYAGIEFDYNAGHLVFTSLSFICLTVIMQNRSDCLFADDNIIRLSRIGSRRKALIIELLKIISTVFVYELVGTVSICVFSFSLKKALSLTSIILMFIMGYLVKLFLMIIQFIMDRVFVHNFGFMLISILFMVLLLVGSGIYYFCEQSSDIQLVGKLLILNKLNLINYVSISRTYYLTQKILYPLLATLGLIGISIGILYNKIKNINLLSKE